MLRCGSRESYKIIREDLSGNAARLESILLDGLKRIQQKHPERVGHVSARGLVGGMQMVKTGKQPDHDTAHAIIEKCFHKGLLFFAPVGAWGQTVKIAPPLTIPAEALNEGLSVLSEAVSEVLKTDPEPAKTQQETSRRLASD